MQKCWDCNVVKLCPSVLSQAVTLSSMMRIGKNTWNAWVNFTVATTTFTAITQDPTSLTLDSLHMRRLERLTVLMFSKNCAAQSVNEARKLMFTHDLKSLDSIPPTQNALFQHAKRALHAVGISPSRSFRRSRIPVTGAGNGMPEPTSGCHIGRICQTSTRLARCSSNVGVWLPVRVTANVIELDSIAVHCASAKAAALTMKVKCDVHATLLFVLMTHTTETARFLCINPTII